MEGLIIAGVGLFGIFCNRFYSAGLLRELEAAPMLTANSPDGQFGHVYGPLTSETATEIDGVKYVNVFNRMYERSALRTVVSIGNERSGQSNIHLELLTTTKIRCKDLSIGGLSVMSMINHFQRVNISEDYTPVQSFGGGGGNVSIVKVDNSKSKPILGDHERETLGHKTIVSGVPTGLCYTVFGTKSGSSVHHFGYDNDMIVPNMTPAQVIQNQRDWNNGFLSVWAVTTCVGIAISAAQFATRH